MGLKVMVVEQPTSPGICQELLSKPTRNTQGRWGHGWIRKGPFLNTNTKRYSYKNLLCEIGGPGIRITRGTLHSKRNPDTKRSTKIISNSDSTKIYMPVKQMWQSCYCGWVPVQICDIWLVLPTWTSDSAKKAPSIITLLVDTHGITSTRRLLKDLNWHNT